MSFSKSRIGRLASLTALLLAALLVLASCGGSSEKSSGSAAQQKLRLGLVLPDLTNQTINDIYLGAKEHAAQLKTVTINEGGTSETPQWLEACERIVNSHPDVLAYDTLDAAATSTCIKQANDAGIKTICIFACTAEGKNDALITLDFENDGKLIGAWMAKALNKQGNVGFLAGPPGDEAATAISKGFKESLASECPNCKLVAEAPGGHDRNTGYTVGQQVLTAHPDIQGMYGLNDDIAMGIVKAVQQEGKLGKIKIAGHNGTCEALASIIKGDLSFTILLAGQPFGKAIVDTALKLKAGQTVSTVNVTPIPIDQATAKGIMAGTTPNPPDVDVKSRLEQAQSGCK
jgi:ribose transport system substrate-binding protein